MSEPSERRWYERKCFTYPELKKHLENDLYDAEGTSWVFRGQVAGKELETSLERHCKKSRIEWHDANKVERTIIREFRRLYQGEDRDEVMNDTLYCLSLLRHHGAPARLLDFSYSRYVGLYFGLQQAYENLADSDGTAKFALWCIDALNMNHNVEDLYAWDPLFHWAYSRRAHLRQRNDKSFQKLYMRDEYDLVISENPVRMHQRLHLQQGVLLCPGRVTKPFMENLRSVFRSNPTEKVKQLVCTLTVKELEDAFDDLRRMNITEESLFPGLDGHARSVRYQMRFYLRLSERIAKEHGS